MARLYKCNMCGREIDKYDISEHMTFEGVLGYGSKYDGEYIEIDFCPECMDKLIEECAISPVAGYEDDDDDIKYTSFCEDT